MCGIFCSKNFLKFIRMTQIAIEEQLVAQQKTTEKATKSKKAANNYLISLGVLKENDKKKKSSKSK